SRRRHTRFSRDWSSDVCSADLLTFHKGHYADREVLTEGTPQCPQRGDVDHDAGLVVGAAATVEATVPFGSGERVTVPHVRIASRLHVMVGVEQDCGRSG